MRPDIGDKFGCRWFQPLFTYGYDEVESKGAAEVSGLGFKISTI